MKRKEWKKLPFIDPAIIIGYDHFWQVKGSIKIAELCKNFLFFSYFKFFFFLGGGDGGGLFFDGLILIC